MSGWGQNKNKKNGNLNNRPWGETPGLFSIAADLLLQQFAITTTCS
ncbi:hypothetical protein [Yersinia rohdei]|nr:hypothetical protein [Yersinia rohdei]MDN0093425.1 hypothetical protein [Yersinia rohdei]